MQYRRQTVPAICKNLSTRLPVFQVIMGPRQVGKTTAAKQIAEHLGFPSVYA
jgi:uncharacterized protein